MIARIVGVTSDRNNRAGARFGQVGVSSGEIIVARMCADEGAFSGLAEIYVLMCLDYYY